MKTGKIIDQLSIRNKYRMMIITSQLEGPNKKIEHTILQKGKRTPNIIFQYYPERKKN